MIKYVINTERARKTKIREKTRMTTFLSSRAHKSLENIKKEESQSLEIA